MNRPIALIAALFALGCQSKTQKSDAPASVAPPAGTATAPANPTSSTAAPSVGNAFITHMRQLTFDGARAGEGYFSKDGRRLIFQSEREGANPFYQMYVMDLKTGATNRISPGNGKTTCGWIHPSGKQALFASTHADPEWKKKADTEYEDRKRPKRGYSWNFDDAYEIYQADLDGKRLKNLTRAKGYDAEGSYSPDGNWIAFASNREGYAASLTTDEAARFARDPSYLMDIYIMRADGSQVKRLTTEPGYDGGPFFSPDGKRITYRHFTPDGRTAEVYTMNVDGSDKKQITRFGSMSWAPFYHPSGEYLIFASSKFGHANFELFIVDVDGKREPARVTQMEGFDGLPVFTPQGDGIIWTHSNERGEAQLYRGDWNDALARRSLGLPPAVPVNLTAAVTAADARKWVEYLASPRFGGRLTGNEFEQEYVEALAGAFKQMGLKADVQNYAFASGIDLGPNNKLELRTSAGAQPLVLKTEWVPLSYSKAGGVAAAPLVFAGYGISASANPAQPAYDAYAGLDVKDKWAVVFSDLPQNVPSERRFFLHIYSHLQHKAMVARMKGAAGLIVIEDAQTPTPEMRVRFEGRGENAGIPVIRLSAATADKLFAVAKTSRREWTQKLATGETAGFLFPNAKASAEIDLSVKKSPARNVLAWLQVPGATGTVVVGAHLDHLGHGEMGNSLSPDKRLPHPGADDNASGVAGVMEAAQALAKKYSAREIRLKQNVLFALWTGEEIGVLGSAHFANTTKTKINAYLNMDMIGRYRDQLQVLGTGSARQWKSLIEQASSNDELTVQTQEDPYLPSDALTFYMNGIPSVMLFTGSHPQYHTPEDTPDRVNYDGLVRVAVFAARLTELLAAPATSPVTYQKVESSAKPGAGRGFRLYLGTIPDYSREVSRGVAISGTSKNSPAEKAGLQSGDIIVELGGMKIQNINDYVYCLQALKANERTRMRILRAGQERELEIVPLPKASY